MKKLLPFFLLIFAAISARAQTTITLGTGTSSASTNALFSTSTTGNKYARTIAIYSAAEITAAGGLPGLITKLAWYKDGTGEYTASDISLDIYLKHVSYTVHPTNPVTWATDVVGATQVFSSTTAGIPTGTGYKDYVFTTPFLWDGTSNLAVFVDFYRPGTPTGSINWQYTTVTSGMTATQVNSVAIPTVRHATNRPNMQLTFAPATPTDVGIIAVTAPASSCGLTNQESVTVTIRNFGSATQTSIPVVYSLNGTAVPAETFTGSLAAGATATYTFTAKADLSVSGPHTIVAETNLTGDANAANNATSVTVTNSLTAGLPQFDFETPATGIGAMRLETKTRSTIVEGAGASNGTGSTQGMIMAGVANAGWIAPIHFPWTTNAEHFSAAYICFNPAGGNPNDPLWLSFDLKQLFKQANINTNFRITVNGNQVGSTYNPPFDPSNPATPIAWRRIHVDLTSFKSEPSIVLGFESLVMEEYANGTGTANLIDNIQVVRFNPLGRKDDLLQNNLNVFPNPSAGVFTVSLPQHETFTLEVTDLTGKVIKTQQASGKTQLELNGTAKGIYLLKGSGKNGMAVKKLIVE